MNQDAAKQWALERGFISQEATLEPLTGGLINELWRASDAHGSVILKHTTSAMREAPTVKLDPRRGQLEVEVMRFAQAWTSPHVKIPRVLGADASASIFAMEDAGALPKLSQWLLDHATLDAATTHGARLGQFLARLHTQSTASLRGDAARFCNDPIQRTRAQVQYDAVGGWCERAKLSIRDEAIARAMALGESFMRPGRCLIMGDLWPSSILVEEAPQRLWIIDWEFAHWGQPEQDLAHLFAHLFMLQGRSALALRFWGALWEAWRAQAGALYHAKLEQQGVTHAACEVLIRTIGAFSQPPDDAQRALAVEAIGWLEDEALTLADLTARQGA